MSTSWRRIRGRGETPERPTGENEGGTTAGFSRLDGLGSPGGTRDAQADRYAQWADRLRDKRARNKERIAHASGANGATHEPTYWDSDNVYRETRRIEQEAAIDGAAAQDIDAALATLGLPADADRSEIEARYRDLAKQHHPDRHHDADLPTQDHHAAQFRAVNDARAVLLQVR